MKQLVAPARYIEMVHETDVVVVGSGLGGMAAAIAAARVPGAPHWQRAPGVAGFKNKQLSAICQQLKDPKRNGGICGRLPKGEEV